MLDYFRTLLKMYKLSWSFNSENKRYVYENFDDSFQIRIPDRAWWQYSCDPTTQEAYEGRLGTQGMSKPCSEPLSPSKTAK